MTKQTIEGGIQWKKFEDEKPEAFAPILVALIWPSVGSSMELTTEDKLDSNMGWTHWSYVNFPEVEE